MALTLENVFGESRGGAGSPVISPDGTHVAFTGDGPDGRGIYLTAVENGSAGPPRFWLDGRNPVWAPDGQKIVFLRAGQLWSVEVGSADASQITKELEGVRAAAFSPDGRTIAIYSSRSGAQDIWLVSADGATAPRQLTQESMTADDTRFGTVWSPDGRTLAYVSNQADWWHDDVWVVDVESGATRQLSRSIMALTTPVWSPSGDRLAVMGTAKSDFWYLDMADIFLLDVGSGGVTKVDMQTYATGYRNRAFWPGLGTRIFFPYMERGEQWLWRVAPEGGVASRVTHLGGVQANFDTTASGDAFVFTRTSPTEGSDVYYLPTSGGPARRITDFAGKWEGLQTPQEVSYPSWDGLYIQGFLYLPPQVGEGQQCPALVQVHGGGTNSYMQSLNLTEQYLASRGYVVLAINYRGGSGFGREFQDLSVEDWLNGQAKDPGPAADYLRTLPYVNGKVGIYGGSYGGMQSMAAITRTPDKFDAAVPMRGIYSQSMTFPFMDRVGKIFARTGHGGLPEERPEIYAKTNTIDRFENITTPLLILHGEEDVRAPFRNYELAVEKLKALGKEFESKSYPGEGHGFRDPANRIDMYRRLETFFAKHLGACGPKE